MNCSCTQQQSSSQVPLDALEETKKHPCFSFEAHHKYARMHLPVAPYCNISCNYCNRKFDCLHESRPGVTSEVLSSEEAHQKYNFVKEKIENLSVAGIAGPGDALANWVRVSRTIELIKKSDPDVVFCLSTNGLTLPEYAGEIIDFGIKHVTVTVNCLEPEIGAKIYRFVNYKGKRYEGVEGAEILIKNQLAGIATLARHGVVVKVNIVMIDGINDHHIPDVVKKVKDLGAFITNIMPLIPAKGSAFEKYTQTSMKDIHRMRNICQADLRQMVHCKQCRADAIGLLGEDRSLEFRMATVKKEEPSPCDEKTTGQYKIAVTSKTGKLIDQHFGHASEFSIYQGDGELFQLVEKRQVARYCSGMEECDSESKKENTVNAIRDCDAVISLRVGYHAKEKLLKNNILSVEHYDTIENGLRYAVTKLNEKEAV